MTKLRTLSLALFGALGVFALSAPMPIGMTSPAYAQRACNVLYTGAACVKCAQGRGYSPTEYCPYCGNPNVKECTQPKKQRVKK